MSASEEISSVGVSSSSRSNTETKSVSIEEHEKILEKLRQCEDEKMSIMKDHGNLIKEFNRRMHVHLEEIRLLKEVNHKLQADMQELRDLCCYLDDDRHKCRKLAREWQRFGRHTAAVMKNELSDYQNRVRFLEDRQYSLSSDNYELKELCLYLDKQREVLSKTTDVCSKCSQSTDSASSSPTGNSVHDVLREKGLRYSEKLEKRLSSIGLERKNSFSKEGSSFMSRKKRVSFTFPEEIDTDTDSADSLSRSTLTRSNGFKDGSHPSTGILRNGIKHSPQKECLPFTHNNNMTPEAVEQAMKVLEIHDKLGDQTTKTSTPEKEGEKLDENEVAVLKEMCNVVWRKLANGKETDTSTKVNGHGEHKEEVLQDLL